MHINYELCLSVVNGWLTRYEFGLNSENDD